MKPILIFIINEEPLTFSGVQPDVCIEGQDQTSTFFFTCSLDGLTSDKGESLLYFSLQKHGADADGGMVWNRKIIIENTPTDDDARHAILRGFLFECCADLFLVGFYLFGSYEYNGQKWEVEHIHKVASIDLPDGFDFL